MADRSDEARSRAEAKFKKKVLQTTEAEKIWAEHAAAEKAGDDKRTRLKSLRLAKEAADQEAKATPGSRARKPALTRKRGSGP